MRIEYKGEDITGVLGDLSINMSFDNVFSTVSMSASILLTDCTLILSDDVSYDLVLWSSHRSGASFDLTFVSKLQYQWLMSSVNAITGKHSFTSICKRVGVPFLALSQTDEKYYEMPQMKFFEFLEWVQNRTSCKRAWLMTLHFDGIVGVDTDSFLSGSAPAKIESPFYAVNAFTSVSDHLVSARAEGVVYQNFIDKAQETVEFSSELGGRTPSADTEWEFITVNDLSWVTPNVQRQQYLQNIDTAARMEVSSDDTFFVLGALFTDDKGGVYFVNSVLVNEGGQRVTLCYVKSI